MVFASLTFLYVFLPATLLLYYVVPAKAYRNGVLIVASLVFYAWGEPVWIGLLIFSATADYLHGRIIERYRGRWPEKAAVVSCLVTNLGLLGLFKYSSMLVSTINSLTGIHLPIPSFSLPIGISFYTFQTISYTLDVHRGKVRAQTSYWRFLLFVSLFHQLVAGPIVRYAEIEDAINDRRFRLAQFSSGVGRFVVGLAKKVAIANVAGELARPFLDGSPSVLGAWYGLLLFGIQIYFDFSGYSDMAIGLGRMFGFEYSENFRYPYVSRSATEFWRRWHISLGTFFRDYLYIPMGGNRRRQLFNLLVVWFLTGLWHGASWNFVLWGLYYGVLIAIERLLERYVRVRLPAFLGHLYLGVITLVGWSLFYFTDMSTLGRYLGVIFGASGAPAVDLRLGLSLANNAAFVVVAAIGATPVVPWLRGILKDGGRLKSLGAAFAPFADVAGLVACTALLVGSGYNPFLYFRF